MLTHSPSTGEVRAEGCHPCGSVWSCPSCAARITEVRCGDLIEATRVWAERGGSTAMLTLTVPHGRRDALVELWSRLRAAMVGLREHRTWKLLVRSHIAGIVRATEITVGEANGWHPHFHLLLFVNGSLDAQAVAGLQARISAVWQQVAVNAGLGLPDAKIGCNLVTGKTVHDRLAAYVAKWARPAAPAEMQELRKRSWGAERELTKLHVKRCGDAQRHTPFELLDAYASAVTPSALDRYRGLWLEYVTAMKGQRQLVWSRGLKAMLAGMGATFDDRSDEEVAASHAEDAVPVATVSAEQWRWLVLLRLAESMLSALAVSPLQATADVVLAEVARRRDTIRRIQHVRASNDPPPWPDAGNHDLARQSAA